MATGNRPDLQDSGEVTDERLQLVLRIMASPSFRRAQRLREFLLYVVEHTLAGDREGLSEHQIGRAVFGRPPDYSPSEDNVVRVHARQLRLKLSEFFQAEGLHEPLVLDIPKGSYAAAFTPREPLAPAPEVRPKPPAAQRWKAALPWVIAGLAVAVAALVSITGRGAASAARPAAGAVPVPLAWVLDGRKTSIVVADSCFGLMQDIAGRTMTLDEYLNPEFLAQLRPLSESPVSDMLLRRVRSRELTSYADLMLGVGILKLAGAGADALSIRLARELRPRDLKSGNFIFLGSPYTNPWVRLFDERRNFRIDFDQAAKRGYIVNKHPHPNEQRSYTIQGEDGVPGETLGIVTFLPADVDTGNVLIVEGANMEGTEGAGARITDPVAAREMLAAVGISPRNASPRYLEVLLTTRALGGAPSETRIAAWRK